MLFIEGFDLPLLVVWYPHDRAGFIAFPLLHGLRVIGLNDSLFGKWQAAIIA